MADMNVALILRLVDRLSAPARNATRSVTALGEQVTAGARATTTFSAGVRGAVPVMRSLDGVQRVVARSSAATGQAIRRQTEATSRLLSPTRVAASVVDALHDHNRELLASARNVVGGVDRESTSVRRLAEQARSATSAGGGLTNTQDRIASSANSAAGSVGRLADSLETVNRGWGNVSRGATGMATTAAVITGAVSGATAVLLQPAREYEAQLTGLITAFDGNARRAREEMAFLTDFARTTPYETNEVIDAATQARNYGLDTHRSLRSIGNASSAMRKSLMQGVEAVSDAMRGENERLKEFGITAERAGGQVRYFYQQGTERRSVTVSANDPAAIERALTGIFDANYAGGMERQSRTFNGMLSNISDAWNGFRLRVMQDGGVFDWLSGRVRGFLGTFERMAASGELDRFAQRFGRDLVRTLEQVEEAAKTVGRIVMGVVRGLQPLADCVGGWPNLILLAAGARIAAGGLQMLFGAGQVLWGAGSGARRFFTERNDAGTTRMERMSRAIGRLIPASFRGRLAGAAAGVRMFMAANGGLLGTLRMLSIGLLTTPVGWLVTALVIGAVLIIRNWDRVSAFLGGFWRGLRRGLEPVWRQLQAFAREFAPLFAPLAPVFEAIADAAGGVWRWLNRLFNPTRATAEELRQAGDAGEQFGQAVARAIDFVLGPIKVMAAALRELRQLMERPVVRRFWDRGRRYVGRARNMARERVGRDVMRRREDEQVQQSFWAGLEQGLAPAAAQVRTTFSELASAARTAWKPVEALFGDIGDATANLFRPLHEDLMAFEREVERVFAPLARWFDRLNGGGRRTQAAAPMRGAASETLEARMRRSRSLGERVGEHISGSVSMHLAPIRMLTNLLRLVPPAMSAVGSSASTAWAQLSTSVQSAWSAVSSRLNAGLNWLASLPSRLAGYGRNMMDGLRRGIVEGVERTLQAVRDAASRLAQTVRNVLGIRSPSRVFMEIGRNVTEGLGIGIRRDQGGAARRASELAARVTGAGSPRPFRYRPSGFGDRVLRYLPQGTSMRRQSLADRMTAQLRIATEAQNDNGILNLMERLDPVARREIDDSYRPVGVLDFERERERRRAVPQATARPVTVGDVHVHLQGSFGGDPRVVGAAAGQAAAAAVRRSLFDLGPD